jgi:hypothetical protein
MVKLENPIGEGSVHFNQPETTNCPGNVSTPTALPGHLCVYLGNYGITGGMSFKAIERPDSGPASEELGAGRTGALVAFTVPTEDIGFASGTFAVTAPTAP